MTEQKGAREVSIDDLAGALGRGATVIDVREIDEYVDAHVPGVRLVPLGTLPDELGSLPRDETIYVICRSGARSLRAADYLQANGVDAVSVAGGTMAWMQSGRDHVTGDDR